MQAKLLYIQTYFSLELKIGRKDPAGIYLLKVNFDYISLCSSVFIVNFEHVIAGWGKSSSFQA